MDDLKQYLLDLGIYKDGEYESDSSYVISLIDSEDFGKIYSLLEDARDLELMQENQVVTTQGSSLLYESKSFNYILNLIADFEGNIYKLVITNQEN